MADTKERLATAQWVLERNLGWITAADAKVSVVTTINLAMLGGLAAAYSQASAKTCWVYLFSSLSAAFVIISLACAAISVLPRLDGPKHSLLFFGRIAEMGLNEYQQSFKQSPDEDFLDDLTEQIHRNAEIAKEKHRWVKNAMALSFLSVIPWVVSIALLINA